MGVNASFFKSAFDRSGGYFQKHASGLARYWTVDSRSYLKIRGTALVLLSSLIIVTSGCATNRAKTFALMGASALVGGTIGALISPPSESAGLHAILWGSASSTVAAIASSYLFDSEKDKDRLETENRKLQGELAKYGKESELLPLGTVSDEADVPSELKGLIRPGRWQPFRIGLNGQWIKQTERKWIHQDLLMVYQPGAFDPNGQSQTDSTPNSDGPKK